MADYNSNNPMLKNLSEKTDNNTFGAVMTRNGAIGKTVLLFGVLLAGAGIACFSGYTIFNSYAGWIALLIIGTVFSFVTAFVPKVSPFTAPVYALVEGMLLGAISAQYNYFYNGIISQAILVTVGIFAMTLIFYSAGIVKVTNRFRSGILIATTGVLFVYLADIVLTLFGTQVPFLHSNGIVGIAINVLIIIIASLNFMIDFDYFDRACMAGAPKYMEWYMGYSIMVTFVWLYLEVLRLLSKFKN